MHFSGLIVLVLATALTVHGLGCQDPGTDMSTVVEVLSMEALRHGAGMSREALCAAREGRPCYCLPTSLFLHWEVIDYSIAIAFARQSPQYFAAEEILRHLSVLDPDQRELYLAPLERGGCAPLIPLPLSRQSQIEVEAGDS
jgi:hypothetical protein